MTEVGQQVPVEPGPTPAPGPPPALLSSTAAVAAGNLVSRITGFGRVLAIALALGTTFAGNTYQTSNLVSNVLFELLAAGILSSVMVPPFVRLLDEGRREDAERLAGSVLGLALAALGAVTLVGVVARPWIMRALTVAVDDPAVRRQEIALGSFLLVFFLPQVLLYAVCSVATGLLHGARRFVAAAFAPVANNVVVIATMLAFWALANGRPGLDLSTAERLVLGVGTTVGVLAMAVVPMVALRRAGVRLRPRWSLRQDGLRRLGRDGAWAAGLLALNQLLIVTTLILANRIEGGVVAYHIAFQVFLLPFALLAHPVTTTLYPHLASDAQARRWPQFQKQLGGGVATVAFLALPAAALLVALAGPVFDVLRLGNLDAQGARLAAHLAAAFGLGLVGYALFHLLVRASYAAGDTRTPTLVAMGVTVTGSVVMAVWFGLASGAERLAAVGFGHSIAYLGGAAVLAACLGRERLPRIGTSIVRSAACAAAAGAVAWAIGNAVTSGSRVTAAAALVAGSGAGALVYVAAQRALGSPELKALRRS